jgi:hypothetical protein
MPVNAVGVGDQPRYRFFGESSSAMLVNDALDLKSQYERNLGQLEPERSAFQRMHGSDLSSLIPESIAPVLPSQCSSSPQFTFPDDDLIVSLVNLYFRYINTFFPLLHRPSLERNVREGLHYKDEAFAAVLLLVCAVGSRYSDDVRVLLEPTAPVHSSGWKWFDQVQLVRKTMLQPATLYDLQTYCLSCHFLTSSSAPHACWTMVSIGIRLAQDIGVHRWKTFGSRPSTSLEQELWKRAWWVLITFDRIISSVAGRPCNNLDEECDIGLPTECDDEYLDHPDPNLAWKQPPGIPSRMEYFICSVKLYQILSQILRTLYCVDKSKLYLGPLGPDLDSSIVTGLDAALRKWTETIPEHLRWEAKKDNEIFHLQSVSLYAHYYYLQILIHRPLISSSRGSSFSALAICINAARSCSHIIDLRRDSRQLICSHIQIPVFTAAVVLLLNIWGGKRARVNNDPTQDMRDVHRCMDILKHLEKKWQIAGRLWDIICELAAFGDIPLPMPSPSNKRSRDTEDDLSSRTSPSNPKGTEGPRAFASNRRVSSRPSSGSSMSSVPTEFKAVPMLFHHPQHAQQQPYQQPLLPLHTEDLARLPVYSQPGPFSHQAPTMWPPQPPLMHQSYSEHDVQPPESGPGMTNEIPYYGNQHGMLYGSNYPQEPQPTNSGDFQQGGMLDSNSMAVWNNAPIGYELEHWGPYFSNAGGEVGSYEQQLLPGHQGHPSAGSDNRS